MIELTRLPDLLALVDRVRGGASGEAELTVRVSPGQPRAVLARGTSQPDGGCVIVLHDVTLTRRLEAVRRDFVANVSHELRTPVSVVKANAEALLDGALDDPDQARRFTEAIDRHATRLGAIISDLLMLSRIEAGQVPVEPQPVAVREVVDRCLATAADRAGQHQLHAEVPEGLQVRADPRLLEQVLSNLLENALTHTPPGSQVVVRAAARGDRGVIEVADDGPGIPEHLRGRVFERFFRVDRGRTRPSGPGSQAGTGLGLSIVRHLVEEMQGHVEVDANHPHGAVIRVWLPLVP